MSAGGALAALYTGSVGSFLTVVNNVLQTLGWHNAVKPVFEVGEFKLLVHIFLQRLVIYGDFFLGIVVAPLEGLQPISFRQPVDMHQLSS